jgi:putative ABC transport system permease protein
MRTWLAQAAQDARYGARLFRRTPLTTAAAIVTLALGLGLTAVVFSLVNAVLLRPLAAPDSDRLVWVATRDEQSPFPMAMVVGPDFADWKAHARSFDQMVAYTIGDETIAASGTALRARTARVTDDFWSLSGARLEHGRPATATEGSPALVVSYRFFENVFGGDPARLGGRVTVDGRPATIVGVLARDFRFHFPPSPWLPEHQPIDAFSVMRVETGGRQMQLLNVVARLRPDVSLERARAEIAVLRARAARANPGRPGQSAQLILSPLAEELVGGARRGLVVLFLAVTFVLLIVCANIASLLLGRAARRRGEMAVRTSLGATRARLARQLVAESLVLAAFGTAAGLVLAQWGIRAAIALVPHAIPRLAEATIDGSVLAFTIGLGAATACLFTCGPLVPLWTTGAPEALSEAGRHSTAARSPWLALCLAGAQIALAFVLLAGAGLLLKSFWRLHAYPPDFHPDRVLVLNVQLSGPRYEEGAQRKAYATSFLDAVRALPGVRAVSLSTHGDSISLLKVEGAPATSDQQMVRSSTLITSTSAGLADVLGLEILSGRWLRDHESAPVVVVNEAVARRDFPGSNAIGRRIEVDEAGPRTIVGVVGDAPFTELGKPVAPEVFVPYADGELYRLGGLIRTDRAPRDVAPTIRTIVSALDRSQSVYDLRTLEQALADSIRPRRFNTVLVVVLGATAWALALVGIYAVVALGVAGRVREIGVRVAIGAGRADIVRLIVRQGAIATAGGAVVGLATAAALTRWLESLLYDVSPLDSQVLLGTGVLLVGAALLASWIPARAAARLDPVDALRRE